MTAETTSGGRAQPRLLFATGGSGGHIYPALAVAEVARKRGYEVHFIGAGNGMESRLVPEAGFPLQAVRAGKWHRGRPDPRQALAAAAGLWQAIGVVRSLRPAAVVGFGGFASFPGAAAAALLGVPLVLHEGNAFPGQVTRWLARRAKLVVVSQPEAADRLQKARRTTYLPEPIRERRIPREAARARLGVPADAILTLVMGGSQGSQLLNRAVPVAYRQLNRPDMYVLHSTGPHWCVEVAAATRDLEHYQAVPYVDATVAWSAADLAITRAGVSTLAEAAYHGVPLIAVPLPSAAEDHQRHNALALSASGGGRMVEEAEIGTLSGHWQALLDPASRAAASEKLAARSPAGAADSFVDLLANLLGNDPIAHRTVAAGEVR